ncbi:MAG TPA: hypothetical protein VEI97_06830, partial [bacterium]|nr:hypothetical protein [bacterium]
MVQRSILLSALAASLLGLTACGGGSTGDPTAPPPADLPQSPAANEPLPVPPTVSGRPQLGGVAANGDLLASALAVYTIEIDPGTLSATARLKETRQGAANDDLYLLSIGTFLKPDSFTITRVSSDGTTLDVGYEVKHPFPAPSDPTGTPNGSTNRADLGIAGMVLFTVDVPGATGNTYFDEGSSQVIANTQLVTNPDAYYRPAGLLTTGSVANTFPYKLLVDETADPRTSGASGAPLSNGGDVTGNFGTDGWTRAEFGSTNDGWTGYGFLHQGQVAGNTISLDRATLVAAGSMRLDAAIIAKYQDPRGGANGPERKANRLPPATPDHRLFAYRGNHAALDVERIAFAGESGGFVTNQISASTLRFQVADWDARASETTAADLSEEADATLVAPGESGLPGLAVSIPGVLGDAAAISTWDPATDVADDDSAVGGDAAQDSGRPGDPLFYTRAVTKLVTSGQSDGTYVGMVRATDPEQAAPLALPLDGTTLTPLTSDLPDAATYQAFTVEQITPNSPPTLTLQNPAGTVASGNGVATFNVTAYNDPNGDPVQLQFDWNNDGDFSDTGEALQTVSGATPVPFASPIFYNNATLTPAGRSVPYRYTDGVIPSPITGTGSFTLGPNQAPTISAGTVGLANPSLVAPATFSLTATGLTVADAEGDAITFTVTADANNNGSVEQTASSIVALAGYNATPVMGPWNSPNSPVRFRAYANDATHAGTAGTAVPSSPATLLGTVTPANNPPTLALQNPAGPVASGNGVLTFNVTSYNDPDGNTIQIQFDWNNDGDFSDTGEALQTVSGATPVPFSSPIFYNNATLTPAGRSVPYRYTDGVIATPLTGTGSFTLGANQGPTFAGTVGLQ